ncbi:Monoglucosyldiacylglycerol epimerase [Colletotrichum shisoi]|uniref:Monoglucosyldiacylglycerol epimerase n=1 Tax=Colletotrichum shisoi TaxID=2078593 RepID=A0A5Q4BIW6_9PEZI|nr:Monoglucosyldiacylglycerol epimerase [Colletotrichum shisoi]
MSWTFCLLAFRGLALDMAPDLILVLFLQVARTAVVAWNSGHDSNHVPYPRLPKDPFTLFVGPQYHALHHIDPLNYFGSMTRLLDWWMGTAVSLRGRRVTMTGSSGALGQALAEQLRLEGSTLRNTDVLILAHGSKNGEHDFEANCESAVKIIEIFRESCGRRKLGLLPEVWYVGSEAELHGAWTSDMRTYTGSKRAFVRHARAFYDEETFNYRHIVPAAFASGMGPGLVSARWAARVALWWVRRGARYVPVTYTGLAFVNFLRFKLGGRLANQQGRKPQPSTSLEGTEPGGKQALSLGSL